MAVTLGSGTKQKQGVRSGGFALPTILISSVVMLIVLLVSVTSTVTTRTVIKNQYYEQLAQIAGEAGVAYAEACLAANGGVPQWSDSAPLRPNTDCTGAELVACPAASTDPLCSVTLNGNIRSSFSMGKPVTESPSVLVVAGGGSGGGSTGGGGGGGGVVYSPSSAVGVGTYPVVVGAGGAIPGNQQPGRSGENSSFNGIVAIGGGGGGYSSSGGPAASGLAGGSGGGGQNYSGVYPAGLGTNLQGNDGGSPANAGAGGGGGAGGSGGVSATTNIGGAGGPGIANSITGVSVLYGGGGGGGNTGTAGTGGGGAGATSSGVGGNGTANTGGGGGGGWAYATGNGGSGGSGVVIVSYPTGLLTATGGTITTANGRTIHRFTSSANFVVTAVSNEVKTLPNTGYVEILRTSTGAVWRRYDQKSAPVAVVPDLCSGQAKSIYGWNNATVVDSTKTIPGYDVQAVSVANGSLSPGPIYLRKDFSVTQPGTYNLSGVAGSTFNAYIDGRLVISNAIALTTQAVSLQPGCHTIEVKNLNGGVEPGDFDLKMVLVQSGSSIPIVQTDSSWRTTAGSLVHFTSPDYFRSTSWGTVREIQAFNDTTPVWGVPSPAWNTTSGGNTSARWISTTHNYTSTANYPANSSMLLRDDASITISEPTLVRVTYACDDTCDIWLNGSIIASKTAGTSTSVFSITTTLSEGVYRFGATVGNANLGASALLFAAVRVSDGVTLSRSGPGWSAANLWFPTASSPTALSYNATYTPNPSSLQSAPVDLLIVGGGGGGGLNHGGGGGGGGVVYQSGYQLKPGSYSVTVGSGGAGGTTTYRTGLNGANSTFDLLTAIGGGGGGGRIANSSVTQAQQGGSGGGGAGTIDGVTTIAAAGANDLRQGYSGGNGSSDATAGQGGGGGGAGAAGGNATGASGTGVSGTGGDGLDYSITGTSVYYGGGGSGGRWGTGTIGAAGLGGGGTGGGQSIAGSAGTANTGGGGGGGGANTAAGGAGGSGVVIIAYPTGSMTATGGIVTTSGGNTIHRFTVSGTFVVTSIN